MKKLTTGVFTVILGLVAIAPARAEIASSEWVSGQINTAKTTMEATVDTKVDAAKTDLTTEIDKKQNELTAGNNIDITDDTISVTGLDDYARSSAVNTLVTEKVGSIPDGKSAKDLIDVNTNAIDVLNSGAETEGSVANTIASALTDGNYAKKGDITTATENLLTKTEASTTYATTADVGPVPADTTVVNMIAENTESIDDLSDKVNDEKKGLDATYALANAAIPDVKGTTENGGVFVLTAEVIGDTATYKWEPISDRGTSESQN